MSRDDWGSDAPISRPVAIRDQSQVEHVDVGGMIFGPLGLMLPATEAVIEARYTPIWRPVPQVRDMEKEDG